MKMKNICKAILEVDKSITFAMTVDDQGKIQCMSATGEYMVPKKIVEQVGGAWSAVVGGIFRQLAQYYGPFEYTIVKYQKTIIVGIGTKEDYAIFTVEKNVSEKLIEEVRKILVGIR